MLADQLILVVVGGIVTAGGTALLVAYVSSKQQEIHNAYVNETQKTLMKKAEKMEETQVIIIERLSKVESAVNLLTPNPQRKQHY